MILAHTYLLLLIPLIIAAGWYLYRSAQTRTKKKLLKFSPAMRLQNMLRTVNFQAKTWKFRLLVAALCLLTLSMARPLWGPKPDSQDQTGAEFFFILDVSKSMLVRDVEPSRLDAIKKSLSEWLKTRHGDRIGLILMAGDAFVQAPLTSDYTALREVLAQSGPKALSLGGTNIPAAITVAGKALEASGVKNKVVVIISDGENLEGHPVNDVQKAHVEQKITFFTVGVGTSDGGSVPVKELPADFKGPLKEVIRDEFGLPVKSKLDERSLRSIAIAGGGKYFAYLPGGDTWEALYNQSLSALAKKSGTFKLDDYIDLFQIPLFLAILLLALESGISTRNKNAPRPVSVVTLPELSPQPAATTMEQTKKIKPARAVTRVALFLLLTLCSSAFAVSTNQPLIDKADSMVKNGQAAEAAEELRAAAQKNPEDLYLMYNYGIAAYAAKQYNVAADAFSEVCVTPDKKLRAQALTQLGNANYRLGDALFKTNRNGSVIAWERSVEYYENALTEKSSSISKSNLMVAKTRLEKTLMELGDQSRKEADKMPSLDSQIVLLTRAFEAYEKVTKLNPENNGAEEKREEARKLLATKLRDKARELREKADNLPEAKNKASEQEKLNTLANQSYQQARETTPEDKPLAKEHDDFKKQVADKLVAVAQTKMNEAMQPPPADSKKKPSDLNKKKESELQQVLAQTNKALAFDQENNRAQKLQTEVMKALEKTHVEMADAAKAKGDEEVAKPENKQIAQNAAANFNEAVQNYQKALAINEENTHAQEGLKDAQEKLAKQLAEVGKKEMAQVKTPTPAPSPSSTPPTGESPAGEQPPADPAMAGEPPPDANQLREDIGHMEKAAQNFAQAEALSPGKNDAEALQEKAAEKLAGLRSELDKAQAVADAKAKAAAEAKAKAEAAKLAEGKAPGAPKPGEPGAPGAPKPGEGPPAPGEGPPGEGPPGPPGTEPVESKTPAKVAGGGPVKPTLSFSEIRSSTPAEGIFKNLSNKQKVRDW